MLINVLLLSSLCCISAVSVREESAQPLWSVRHFNQSVCILTLKSASSNLDWNLSGCGSALSVKVTDMALSDYNYINLTPHGTLILSG